MSSRIGQAAVSACTPSSSNSAARRAAAAAAGAVAKSASSSSREATVHTSHSRLPSRRALSTGVSAEKQPAVTASSASSSSARSSSSSDAPRGRLPIFARQSPTSFVALRPAPQSALAALAARIGLLPPGTDSTTRARRIALVERACTHPSIAELWDRTREARRIAALADARAGGVVGEEAAARAHAESEASVPPTHAVLATLGNALLGMLGAEALHMRYPHLPTRVLKAALSAHVGPSTAADVGVELGLGAQSILRWDRNALVGGNADVNKGPIVPPRALLMKDVAAQATRALVAVIFQELGMASVRTFLSTRFLSRLPVIQPPTFPPASGLSSRMLPPSASAHSTLAPLLKFHNPKRVLSETCAKYARPRPISRLLAETGRRSIAPVFVVGVYSADIKLGEGTGSSLKMAEYRAAEDALRALYLTQADPRTYELPSTMLDEQFSPPPETAKLAGGLEVQTSQPTSFTPAPLGSSEVIYESRG